MSALSYITYHPQSLSKSTPSHHYLCGSRSRHTYTNLQRAETRPLTLAERIIDSDPLHWTGLTSTTCLHRFSPVRGVQTLKVRSRLELNPSSKIETKRGTQDQQSLLSFLKVTPNPGLRIFRAGSSTFFAMSSNRNSPRRTRERPCRMPLASC